MKRFPRTYAFILALTLLFVQLPGCSKKVTMTRLVPAAIQVPPHIQKILLVDRTKPQSGLVNILEGLITGELPFEVRNAIDATLSALQTTLNTSPRYQITRSSQRLTGGLFGQAFPTPLPWDTIEELCDTHQADAVLVLENFSADFITTEKEKMISKEVRKGDKVETIQVNGIYVEGIADVSAGFRLYDPSQRSIVDQQRFQETNTWSAEAETKTQALSLLIAKAEATRFVGELAGMAYAAKIAPLYEAIDRSYYPKSKTHPSVETGVRYAEVDQWQRAIDTWKAALPEADSKTSGMLLYNIAVGYEVLGDLEMAKTYAGRAFTDFGLKRGRKYANGLELEIQNQLLLENQLQKNPNDS